MNGKMEIAGGSEPGPPRRVNLRQRSDPRCQNDMLLLLHIDAQSIRSYRVGLLCLERNRARVMNHQRRVSILVRLLPLDGRTLHRVPCLTVHNLDDELDALLRFTGSGELEDVGFVEGVIRPEDVVAHVDAQLAAADFGKFVVQEEGPRVVFVL